ncbi:MAG TPA: amidohydrolase family protein [Bacteroidia bacterium]|nr:amidohydrolase family protein [Bacteroidia bacterium]
MKYYNAHTHIFTAQYVPNNVVGIPVMNFLSRSPFGRGLADFAGMLTFGKVKGSVERVAKFAEIGLGRSQEVIFNRLQDYYRGWGDVRFVILMMDMEQMGAGQPLSNYETQLHEIIQLRARGNYRDVLLPFICIDPRRKEFTDGAALLDWVKPFFEKYGFVGIKMYPALGYYPFDEKLDALYGWAQERQVPILYHCIKGVIHYRGPLEGFPPPRYPNPFHDLTIKEQEWYQCNFTEPENYADVLLRFPELKICLAHYGGEDEINGNGRFRGRWYEAIKRLITTPQYRNVYTDVSFSLNDPKIFPKMLSDIQTPLLGERILFGTDYYVVEKDKDEAMLRDELRKFLQVNVTHNGRTMNAFDQIASVNPSKFLTSEFYTA